MLQLQDNESGRQLYDYERPILGLQRDPGCQHLDFSLHSAPPLWNDFQVISCIVTEKLIEPSQEWWHLPATPGLRRLRRKVVLKPAYETGKDPGSKTQSPQKKLKREERTKIRSKG